MYGINMVVVLRVYKSIIELPQDAKTFVIDYPKDIGLTVQIIHIYDDIKVFSTRDLISIIKHYKHMDFYSIILYIVYLYKLY